MLHLKELTISSGQSIRETLEVIGQNARGICFVIDGKRLIGVATDGDIRRGLLSGRSIDQPINTVMRHNYISLPIESDDNTIGRTFKDNLKLIPLCDSEGNIVDIADYLKGHRLPLAEPELCGNELKYLEECIKTNWISSQGKYVRIFENMFEEMHPGTTALAVSNGTVALHLALVSLGIVEGDEVIVPDLTFAATANAVIYTGAKPIFCEVNLQTWCIDAEEAEKLVTKKTKAIIPVHLYGHPCNMESITDFSLRHKLFIVEDCAESIGSRWNDQPVGIFGDAATFSFFGNKTISTGEGGMVLFRDRDVSERAQVHRGHGMSPEKKYWHETIGFNYRLSNLQAAVGVAQLERLSVIVEKKRLIASFYAKHLKKVEGIVQKPKLDSKVFHSYWLNTIKLCSYLDRDELMRKLLLNGIDSRPVFYPLHLMPPYKNYRRSISLSVTENISQHGISLPSSTQLNEDEIKYICEIIKKLQFCETTS